MRWVWSARREWSEKSLLAVYFTSVEAADFAAALQGGHREANGDAGQR